MNDSDEPAVVNRGGRRGEKCVVEAAHRHAHKQTLRDIDTTRGKPSTRGTAHRHRAGADPAPASRHRSFLEWREMSAPARVFAGGAVVSRARAATTGDEPFRHVIGSTPISVRFVEGQAR